MLLLLLFLLLHHRLPEAGELHRPLLLHLSHGVNHHLQDCHRLLVLIVHHLQHDLLHQVSIVLRLLDLHHRHHHISKTHNINTSSHRHRLAIRLDCNKYSSGLHKVNTSFLVQESDTHGYNVIVQALLVVIPRLWREKNLLDLLVLLFRVIREL